ncbi:MAG TPA: polysaccharide biosynthesis/export family protein [Acidobacteriota bacterium]|jgi:polysaccharide export outer membrane protein
MIERLARFLRIATAVLFAIVAGSMVLVGQEVRNASDLATYVIQPNDILEIFVWKQTDLSRKVLVRPDGRISVPLVQDIEAGGSTPGELKANLEARLKEYIISPHVTVIVDTIQHYKIYVIGKVQKPGSFPSEKPISALQALTLAGGFQDYANTSEITIIRIDGKEHMVFHFNYKDVIKGKGTDQNILLKSGDVVVVP